MTITYNKLVRDRIPETIQASGKKCSTEILSDEEYLKLVDELIKLVPTLFDSQPWSTPVLIQELERIKADAEKIMLVQGGIRTQEQFDAYHDCAIDLIDTLKSYIPGLLKNTDFFSKAFY